MISKGKLGTALSVVEEACGVGNGWSWEPVVAGAALPKVTSLPTWRQAAESRTRSGVKLQSSEHFLSDPHP